MAKELLTMSTLLPAPLSLLPTILVPMKNFPLHCLEINFNKTMNFTKHSGKISESSEFFVLVRVYKQLIEIILYCADATAHTVGSLFFCLRVSVAPKERHLRGGKN